MTSILYLIISSEIGGGPEHLYNLISNIDHSNYKLYIVAPNDGEYYRKFESFANVIEINYRRSFIRNLALLSKMVKKDKIDICHAHGRGAGIYARLLKICNRKLKVVYTFHGIHYGQHRNSPSDFFWLSIERLLAFLTDASIAVSKKEREVAISLRLGSAEKTHLVFNGISIEKYSNAKVDENNINTYPFQKKRSSQSIIIGSIARLDPIKGHNELIKAFKQVKSKHRGAVLVLVGDGKMKSELEQNVTNMNLDKDVFFLGFRNDVPQLLKLFDIFVLASYEEGLPYSIIEALAAKTLVVATKTTGNDEIIIDGYNGLLCLPKDADSLACSIDKMIDRSDMHDFYKTNGVNTVIDKFCIQSMIDKTMDIYESITL